MDMHCVLGSVLSTADLIRMETSMAPVRLTLMESWKVLYEMLLATIFIGLSHI